MDYISIPLQQEIVINDLYTIHYFEYMNDFSFRGEQHDFWEFCCIDKGEAYIIAGEKRLLLKRGEIYFHPPGEFHTVTANGQIAPNLVVVSFACTSKHMDFFKNKILCIDEPERNILAEIIIEARQSYENRLDDPYSTTMIRRRDTPFASEQLIKLSLEHFLIHMIRRNTNSFVVQKESLRSVPKTTKSKSDEEVYNRVMDYLERHLTARVTIEAICKSNMIGRSQLQKVFRDKCGLGIIECFSKLKIDAAKQMIRTQRLNFTQISEQLGYGSVHYFSRQFKKIAGMTPSEYATSIKAVSEKHSHLNRYTK